MKRHAQGNPKGCSSKEQSTPPSADHASTKSAELDLQELLRSWDPENNDCSHPCCIQAVELESNKKAGYALYLEQYEKLDAQLRDRAKGTVFADWQVL